MVKTNARNGVVLSLAGFLLLGATSFVHADPSFSWGSSTNVPDIVAFAMGDLNGDGIDDIAAAVHTTGVGVRIRLGQPGGTFQNAGSIALTGPAPTNLVIVDLDGDGDNDIIVGTSSQTFAGLVPGDLNFLYNNGSASFSAPTVFTYGNLISGITCADFNNDAIEDMVTINGVLGQMHVLVGNGTGGFTAPGIVNLPTSDQGVVQVASADLNNDGNADLVVPCPLMDVVAIFYGNGIGGFSPAVGFPAGNDPKRVDFGDLNGDGLVDMVVTNWIANQATILLQGMGGFTISGTLQVPNPTPNPIGNSTWVDIVVGDFDQNGTQDVAIPAYQALVTYSGNGDGTFQNPVTTPMTGEWSQLHVTDVNGDGWDDIVGMNWVQDRVGNMVNDGAAELFRRGDVNNDGSVSIVDPMATLGYLFVTPSTPVPCLDAADTNDNGSVELADAISLLNYLFVAGSTVPPAPGPANCDVDPTADSLAACPVGACP